jgi:hypothetical protein
LSVGIGVTADLILRSDEKFFVFLCVGKASSFANFGLCIGL